jgi:hypothetical protein
MSRIFKDNFINPFLDNKAKDMILLIQKKTNFLLYFEEINHIFNN